MEIVKRYVIFVPKLLNSSLSRTLLLNHHYLNVLIWLVSQQVRVSLRIRKSVPIFLFLSN